MKQIILSLLAIFLLTDSYGQCCSAGNPSGADGSVSGTRMKDLMVSTTFRHSLSNRYYHNSSPDTAQNIKRSFYNYQNLSIVYGLHHKFAVQTELGYFYDKVQELDLDGENIRLSAHGLGDFSLNIRYIPFFNVVPFSLLVVAGGIKIPIGDFEEEINGVTIPISLQPSSGAFKYNASIFYSRKFENRKLGWACMAFFEYSETIRKGYLVYKYGNLFQMNLSGFYSYGKNWMFTLNTKFEYRDYDHRENEVKIKSTGSRSIVLNPQIQCLIRGGWGILLLADVPVFKNVNGHQLTNLYAIQMGLRKSFSFCN